MTFTEAARIMMTKNPVIKPLTITSNGEYTAPNGVDGYNPILVNVPESSSGGIWSIFETGVPLAVITLSPNVLYFLYEVGYKIGTYMIEGTYNNTRYVKNKGYKGVIAGAIKLNGSPVYYHILSDSFGYKAENHYEYVNGSLYRTFNRQIIPAAVNVSSLSLSVSNGSARLSGILKIYQDSLNFSQYDYSDGSHWEENYAFASSYSPFQMSFAFTFPEYPEVSYTDQIRGNTIEEKYSNWSMVCSDIVNAPSGTFPILSHTINENHFAKGLYLNDDAVNRGYYNNNVAYIAKWNTPNMWA